jgi:large subunit ribosomal protein L25
MDGMKIKVAKRDILGKKTKALRRQGLTPVHIFGHNVESRALQCDTAQLKRIVAQAGATRLISLTIEGDKEPKSVFVREIQRDALGKQLLHVDFYEVKKGERIAVTVPIVLVGEAPAMKGKNRMMSHAITSLNIECLPENVPPQIEVDVSGLLELDQPLMVKDIVLDPSITVHADPDLLVAKVTETGLKEAAEEAAAAAAAAAEAEAAALAGGEVKAEGEGEAAAGAKPGAKAEKPSAESASEKK